MAKAWLTVDQLADPTHPYADSAIEQASYILFKLTAEKYTGEMTTREVFSPNMSGSLAHRPAVVSGQMRNLPVSNSNCMVRKINLRQRPVRKITNVTVNGREQDPSQYQLRNYSFVVRTDRMLWNLCTDEIEVEYEYGLHPPKAGRSAAARLANELILAVDDDPSCAIPSNATSVSRQGIEFQMFDPQTFIAEGRTGIREVDMFIVASNPHGARKMSDLQMPNNTIGEVIQ